MPIYYTTKRRERWLHVIRPRSFDRDMFECKSCGRQSDHQDAECECLECCFWDGKKSVAPIRLFNINEEHMRQAGWTWSFDPEDGRNQWYNKKLPHDNDLPWSTEGAFKAQVLLNAHWVYNPNTGLWHYPSLVGLQEAYEKHYIGENDVP